MFAGAAAAFTVTALNAGDNPIQVAFVLVIFSLFFAIPVWLLRGILNEQRLCPECDKAFEVNDAKDIREYEDHLWSCYADLPSEE